MRTAFKDSNEPHRARNVAKLLYMHMLGEATRSIPRMTGMIITLDGRRCSGSWPFFTRFLDLSLCFRRGWDFAWRLFASPPLLILVCFLSVYLVECLEGTAVVSSEYYSRSPPRAGCLAQSHRLFPGGSSVSFDIGKEFVESTAMNIRYWKANDRPNQNQQNHVRSRRKQPRWEVYYTTPVGPATCVPARLIHSPTAFLNTAK